MTTSPTQLVAAIDVLLDKQLPPDEILTETMRIVGEALHADRCFLYLRQPDQQRGRVAFCWRKNETIPDAIQPHWKPDTTDLPQEDPLIRAALAMQPSRYIDDVETASPDLVNRDFEQKNLGHRALIHAHIQQDGKLWAILQPCVFDHPRHWTDAEKADVEAILPKLQPIVAEFVGQFPTDTV